MTQQFCCGEDNTHIFLSLADVRSYQRKHGGRIYICEFKSGRPATDQDWRPITVRYGVDMTPVTFHVHINHIQGSIISHHVEGVNGGSAYVTSRRC